MDLATKIEIKHDDKIVACSKDLSEKYPEAKVINVETFSTLDEATDHFSQLAGLNDKGDLVSDGQSEALALVNSAHRANCMNRARASHARPKNTITQIRNKAKDDPEVRKQLEAFAKKLGLGELNL